MNTAHSVHRLQVDTALADRGTNLADFIAAGKSQGKNLDEIWMDLRQTTGVRFSMRTLYRWNEKLHDTEPDSLNRDRLGVTATTSTNDKGDQRGK